jgi:hypothetical protein
MTEASPHSTSQRSTGDRSERARAAFSSALMRYGKAQLAAIRLAQRAQSSSEPIRPRGDIEAIIEYLERPAAAESLAARLPNDARLALTFLAVTDATSIALPKLAYALQILTSTPSSALRALLDLGLLAIESIHRFASVGEYPECLQRFQPWELQLLVHPAVLKAARPVRADLPLPRHEGPVSRVRESDGLEPILRLAALWQRVSAEPLRQTMQGSLYKRDRDRLADDLVLTGPVADEMLRLPELASLWLEVAQHIGLVVPDISNERRLAAPPDFWTDNAVHLPQMIANAWMALDSWSELEFGPALKDTWLAALPSLRVALLLLLSALDEAEWVSIDDLADHAARQSPTWPVPAGFSPNLARSDQLRGPGSARRGGRSRTSAEPAQRGAKILESLLLGAAYPLGLVRAAEDSGSRSRLVQLTPLGRYVLALGPTPPARETFDQFLFVQPNFEVIAYRQGLTPQLVGLLSRFAWWSQIGAALELKLTRESIVHGLNGGLSAETMLETLTRHSQRALPAGVVDAVGDWSSRRERVSFYASATLIEFSSQPDRDAALASWPGGGDHPAPVAIAERFLLVEDERSIPFDRLRLASSRDYRRPAEACCNVEPDGITLTLDPARSDLLVDAELARFADEYSDLETDRSRGPAQAPRRFTVTAATLRRGMSRGMSPLQLGEWFLRRTGAEAPAAIQLLLAALTSRVSSLKATRMLILTLPSAKLLDGLIQHPATGPRLGERLGPFTVSVPAAELDPLKRALEELGVELALE